MNDKSEPNSRIPQYVAISREGSVGKKWQLVSAPVAAAEIAKAVPSLPLALLQEGGSFVLAAVLSLIPARNMASAAARTFTKVATIDVFRLTTAPVADA